MASLPHFLPQKLHLAALKIIKIMTKQVKLVFDRKGSVAKTGTGKIEICIYLKAGERKYETVGVSTPDEWEIVAQGKTVVSKIKHYENVIQAMKVLGEEMTMENFNKHIFISETKTPDSTDGKHMFYSMKSSDNMLRHKKSGSVRSRFVDYRKNANFEPLEP